MKLIPVCLLLFASTYVAATQNFTWLNCGPSNALLQISSFAIDPYPPKTNGMLNMALEGELSETVEDGIYRFETEFIGITIANFTGDLCDFPWIQCPLAKGHQVLKQSVAVPPFLPTGPFNVTLSANNSKTNAVIFCVNFLLAFNDTEIAPAPAVPAADDTNSSEVVQLDPEVIDNNPNGEGVIIAIPLINGEVEDEDAEGTADEQEEEGEGEQDGQQADGDFTWVEQPAFESDEDDDTITWVGEDSDAGQSSSSGSDDIFIPIEIIEQQPEQPAAGEAEDLPMNSGPFPVFVDGPQDEEEMNEDGQQQESNEEEVEEEEDALVEDSEQQPIDEEEEEEEEQDEAGQEEQPAEQDIPELPPNANDDVASNNNNNNEASVDDEEDAIARSLW